MTRASEEKGEWVLKNGDECVVVRVRETGAEELHLRAADKDKGEYKVNGKDYNRAGPSKVAEGGHWVPLNRAYGDLEIDKAYPPKEGWVKCRLKSICGSLRRGQ